jgi:hypothetical protein
MGCGIVAQIIMSHTNADVASLSTELTAFAHTQAVSQGCMFIRYQWNFLAAAAAGRFVVIVIKSRMPALLPRANMSVARGSAHFCLYILAKRRIYG